MHQNTDSLPIHSIIPSLKKHLQKEDNAILQAEPGAGKTTIVPLSLLNESWLLGRKILMLEPRRLAAKSAAQRLSNILNEPLGQTIGYRIRHETKTSKHTRIEVVTEGILTRMLQTDPSLEDIGLVIFDEFHERSLHSDLALALCLQGRAIFRDDQPLKLLLMSATLETQPLETLLQTKSLHCSGKSFPVDIQYGNLSLKQDQIIPIVIKQIYHAIQQHQGDILVFLPGQKEIRTIQNQLQSHDPNSGLQIVPLYGSLAFSKQQEAIGSSQDNQRKVVLATNIAQTSLTIEGIRVVIDSGLSREAIFDPNVGITRLHTRRVTQSESIQRTGRAGRTSSGIGYRWWSQEQQDRLKQQPTPEIFQSDLASMVIELSCWGINSIDELTWLDRPPTPHIQQAQKHLEQLGILKRNSFTLTELGESIATLPLDPRIARLICSANTASSQNLALKLASLLSEKDPLHSTRQSDIEDRLSWINTSADKITYKHNQFIKQLKQHIQPYPHNEKDKMLSLSFETARLLANAFPDRIGKRHNVTGRKVSYKLSNGRMAELFIEDHLSQSEWLIAINIGGSTASKNDEIYLACSFPPHLIETELAHLVTDQTYLVWPKEADALIAKHKKRLGKLTLSESSLKQLSSQDISQCACQFVRNAGLQCLPWDNASRNIQARVSFLNQCVDSTVWPNYKDQQLLDSLEEWLAPYLEQTTHKNHLKKLNLKQILLDQLNWQQQKEMDALAPVTVNVASGSNIALNYSTNPPSLEVKLQEMFGCLKTPSVAGIPVKIFLLSPAKKPLAITQDLPFFWKEVYPEIKKEMRGRYPKHPWPEDPLTALATQKTKKALSLQNKK